MSKHVLAINGAAKAVTLSRPPWPVVEDRDVAAVTKVLKEERLQHLAGQGVLARFERKFAAFHGRQYALTTNSGTAALHLSVFAAGVGKGDEVITSPYSWGSTTACILQAHGIPVFADIDADTRNIDPKSMAKRLTPRTKAIVVVHIYGIPCDMDPIMRFANKHHLVVIEDCAQAHGTLYKGRLVGTIGHIGAFSLQTSKHLTAGEGGILIADDKRFVERAMMLGMHPARNQQQLEDEELREYIDSTGYTYRANPLGIAFAESQLKRFPGWVKNRYLNAGRFYAGMKGVRGVRVPKFADRDDIVPSYYSVPFDFIPAETSLTRGQFVRAVVAEGVPIGYYVREPIYLRKRFADHFYFGAGAPWSCTAEGKKVKYRPGDCPVAERVCAENELSITVPHVRSLKLMDQYAAAIRKVLEHADEVPEA